jgi:predicted ABC-type ATPase
MTKPVCIVMVGLPASGKSTRVQELLAVNPELFVYSTDNHIEQCAKQNGWTYDQAFAEFIESATKHMNEQIDIAIRSRQDVIWDQTNLSAKKRAKIINRMRNAGYRVECECILLPAGDSQWEDWQHRMASRPGKTIPDSVIESMMDSFVRPTVDEGFDTVRYYDMYGNRISD